MLGSSSVAAQLVAPQEALSSIKFVSFLVSPTLKTPYNFDVI
jgi:hypothetical protein